MRRFDHLEFENPQGREQSAAHQAGIGQQRHREPDHDEHHWIRLAFDDRRNGLHESALRYYSRALEFDKSLVAGWVGQVQMLIALTEYPEAELWSRKALELFKNNAELLAARGQALCRTGDYKSAQASCDAAIGQPGAFSYPWVARGELMLARRDDIHEYCFDKAVQLDPDWLLLLEIGAIYLHYGRPPKALQRTRDAVERAPDHAYCWYQQAVCELALGLSRPAEKSLDHCLQLVPGHVLARRARDELTKQGRGAFGLFRRLFRSS